MPPPRELGAARIISPPCLIRLFVQPPAKTNAPIACKSLHVVVFIMLMRESNLVQNKTSASRISTFRIKILRLRQDDAGKRVIKQIDLRDNDVGKTRVRPDRGRVE